MLKYVPDILLSDSLKSVIRISQAIARENRNLEFTPAHLLKALLHKDASLYPLLARLKKDIYYLEDWADARIEACKKSTSLPAITGDSFITEVMYEADSIRLKLSKDAIEPVHAMAALSTPGVGFTYDQMKTFPLRRDELIMSIAENDEMEAVLNNGNDPVPPAQKAMCAQHALLKYCIDKSLLAKEGKLDAIVGRNKDIRMMAEILARRLKPNVLLVGEPGVGKSALVDGFALAILQQKVPEHLMKARIFELDTGALVAGASYKGEIEDRLKNILKEIKQFDKAILFIDEIHVLLDKQGSAAGSANLLKPELARGEITVIGATTTDEYRRCIETDEAFSRRFELLTIEEPNADTCFHMIKAVMPNYEKHHGILVPDEAIHETIQFAKRYIKDRRLPDAAIDLADRAMAALRMINDAGLKDIDEIRNKYQQWCKGDANTGKHLLEDWLWFYKQIHQHISPILWSSIQLPDDPDKMKQVSDIKNYLDKVLGILKTACVSKRSVLEKNDVAAIVSYKTGIPIGKVQTRERERLLKMDAALRQRVVGQDHAIKVICEAIVEARAGLGKPGQPIGSFFFLGPTGTGKTELAKALAEFLFHDESAMIRFDMSEFKEQHSAALLLGAPPGFVGYEEGGLLVNRIRQKPYSVVLFDEIEKAHPSVFDIFLQMMDEGKLHDKLDKEGDFSNALIIFTSNIGSQYVADQFSYGKMPESGKMLETMGQYFRPEFLGRLTEIVPFAPVNEEMLKNILGIQLKGFYSILQKQGIQLKISEGALSHIAQSGFHPQFGARPLAAAIRTQLRKPLSAKIISGEVCAGCNVELNTSEEGAFQWTIGRQPA